VFRSSSIFQSLRRPSNSPTFPRSSLTAPVSVADVLHSVLPKPSLVFFLYVYSPDMIVQRLQFVCLEPCEQLPISDKEISRGISSFMQSVPGNTILHLPCDPADLCSDQRSLHNPMEFEMHALLVPACRSAPLQGSLVHHKYSTCNFRILHYGYFCYCIQCTQRSVRRQRISDPVVYKIGYHRDNKHS
jgi:hypothetical protein